MKNLNEFVNEALECVSKRNSINESEKYDGDLRDDLEELCNMNFNLCADTDYEDDIDSAFDDLMDYWSAIFYCAKDDLSEYEYKSGYNFKRTGLVDAKGKEYLVFKKNDDEEWTGDIIIPFILAHYGTEIRPEFEDLIDKDWKKYMVKTNFKKIDLTGVK